MVSLRSPIDLPTASDTALAELAHGDDGHVVEMARSELVRRYRPLVQALARRFAGSGRGGRQDLVSVGYEGLLKTIRDFDRDRGVPFAAYAKAKVHGEMLRWLRDSRYAVHVPRPLHERSMQVRQVEADLWSSRGREPTIQEVAAELGSTPDEVVEALAVASADRFRTATLARAVAGSQIRDETFIEVAQALAALPRRSQIVLYRRYWEGRSQSEVAREIGRSQPQVSRIERAALHELRAVLEGQT